MIPSVAELLELRTKLERWAICSKGMNEDSAQEFAQFTIDAIIRGRKLTSKKNYLADYMRKTRWGEGLERQSPDALLRAVPFGIWHEKQTKARRDLPPLESLSVEERASLILTQVWGFNQYEVGEVLGVCHTRVSQHLAKIRSKLSIHSEFLEDG